MLDRKEFALADLETARKILWVAKRNNLGWLNVRDIKNFPSQDLRTINQLWLAASKGKFGFSVQKKIWMDLGGQPGQDDDNVFNRFIEKVEWAENQEICFDNRAARGHLPLGMYVKVDGHRHYIHNRWLVKTEKRELEEIEEEIGKKEEELKYLKRKLMELKRKEEELEKIRRDNIRREKKEEKEWFGESGLVYDPKIPIQSSGYVQIRSIYPEVLSRKDL